METQSCFLDLPNDRWGSHGDLVAYQRVLPMNFLYITGKKDNFTILAKSYDSCNLKQEKY